MAHSINEKIKDVDCSHEKYSDNSAQRRKDILPIAPNFNLRDTIKQLNARKNEKRLLKDIMQKKDDKDPTPELVEGLFVLKRKSFFDTC